MDRSILWIAALCFPIMVFAGTIEFEDDFDSGSRDGRWLSQYCESWNFDVVTPSEGDAPSTSRGGTHMLRVEARPGDRVPTACTSTGRERSEIRLNTEDTDFDESGYNWYGLSYYFKTGEWSTGADGVYINQIAACGLPSRHLPCVVFSGENNYIIRVDGSDSFWDPPGAIGYIDIVPNSWNDFVVYYHPSTGSGGEYKVWQNGQLVINHPGSNVSSGRNLYFKIGIYGNTSVTNTLFIDEVKLATCSDGEDCYALVSPSDEPPGPGPGPLVDYPSTVTNVAAALSYGIEPEDPGGFWIPEFLRDIWETLGDCC